MQNKDLIKNSAYEICARPILISAIIKKTNEFRCNRDKKFPVINQREAIQTVANFVIYLTMFWKKNEVLKPMKN